MPPDYNNKIDGLLKAFAKRRKEQAGAPFELDGATRAMLQAEVVRRTPHTEEKEARASFFTRIILATAIAASIAICAVIIFKSAPPATELAGAPNKKLNYVMAIASTDHGSAVLPPGSAPVIQPAAPDMDLRTADQLRNIRPPAINGDELAAKKSGLGVFSLDEQEKHISDDGVTISFTKPTNLAESGTNSNVSMLNEAWNSLNDKFVGQNAPLLPSSEELPATDATTVAMQPEGATAESAAPTSNTLSAAVSSAVSSDYSDGVPAKIEAGDANIRNAQTIKNKLDHLIIPELDLHDATVRDAIEFLKKESAELDTAETNPARKGVNITLALALVPATDSDALAVGGLATSQPSAGANVPVDKAASAVPAAVPAPAAPAPALSPADTRITVLLKNVPLSEALRYVTELAGLKYKTSARGVNIVPLSENTEVLVTKEYSVPQDFLQSTGGGVKTARKLLENAGVEFPEGAEANYLQADGKLVVRNTEENLDLVDQIVEAAATPTEADLKQAAENATADVRNVESIEQKLNGTIIPKIECKQATFAEVLGYLLKIAPGIDAGKGDSGQGGLNFVLKTDPAVRITLSLTNVPLGEALRQAAAQAGAKVKVDPYAIVIAPVSESTETLVTKEYTVPPAFAESIGGFGGMGGGQITTGLRSGGVARPMTISGSATGGGYGYAQKATAVDLLKLAGVPFPEGASANYFPDNGKLVVRNTQENLDLVDKIVDTSVSSQLERQAMAMKKLAVTRTMQAVAGKIAGPEVVLATFQLQLEGDMIRIVDADGSIYTGKIEQPVLQKLLADSNGLTFTNVAAANQNGQQGERQELAKDQAPSQSPAGVTAGISNNVGANGNLQQTYRPQQNQNFAFRATGFSRKLNQTVVFEGNYIAAATAGGSGGGSGQGQAQAQFDAVKEQARPNAEQKAVGNTADLPPADGNARIQGEAQIGDGGKIEVDAVVETLKTKAAR